MLSKLSNLSKSLKILFYLSILLQIFSYVSLISAADLKTTPPLPSSQAEKDLSKELKRIMDDEGSSSSSHKNKKVKAINPFKSHSQPEKKRTDRK